MRHLFCKWSMALCLPALFMSLHSEETITLEQLLSVGLPIVVVETVDDEEPTYEESEAPEGCWGSSIRNATKVPGRVVVYDNLGVVFDSGPYVAKTSGMTIKVRGNGSAREPKKPFKIKLQKKGDMMGNDSQMADKDWLLLAVSRWTPMNQVVGMKVNSLCGLQWTPRQRYVNLLFNGDYRGLYLLSESVGRNEECRLDVTKTGFIAELDAYWWNEDFYIPSSFPEPMNYTLKYPDTDDMTPEQQTYIEHTLGRMEQMLDSADYSRYIDVESFARWMLAHDILANIDGGGSNIFLTKRDSTDATRVMMGCLWDFDAIMLDPDTWDAAHNAYYFKHLWANPNTEFAYRYAQLWEELKDDVFQGMDAFTAGFLSSPECWAVDSSVLLDRERWGTDMPLVSDYCNSVVIPFFEQRRLWLDDAITDPMTVRLSTLEGERHSTVTHIFDVCGRLLRKLPATTDMKNPSRPGLYIQNGRKRVVSR